VPGASDRRTVSFSYDNAARLSSLSSSATSYAPAASVSSIAYAATSALVSQTYGNNLIHAVSYNSRQQTSEIKLGTSGAPTSVVDLNYSYGTTANNGNLQSVTYSGGGLSNTQSFTYDSLNRLSAATETTGSTTNWSQTNVYDRYGNRQIDFGGGSYNLSFSGSTNRVTTSGFTYDSSGNLTNIGNQAYAFDAENKISKVDNVSAYVYDGEGQRVRKLVGENTRFVYGIGGQLVAEFDGSSGNLKKEYVYGSSLITIEPTAVNSNGTQYSMSDHLGSPRVVTNSSASIVSRHDFMPFGEELAVTVGGRTTGMGFSVADGLRQKFTLKERDIETGLDYFLARYYSSIQGRFASVDPLMASAQASLPQSWNRYSYSFNNPLAFIDPDGRRAVPDDYYADRDGQITIDETPGTIDRFHVQNSDGTYTQVATLQRNNAGLVQFPDNGTGFNRYGIVDAGGQDRATGENVGQGDHFLQPVAAAALFGTINVLNSDHHLTVSLGDMSSSNGSDPWQSGQIHHDGHGHRGNRTGEDIDFRYLNNNGVSFQSQTARSDPQFSVQNNQTVYDTARTFGLTTNYQGTNRGNNGEIQGVTRAGGHNDHGHLGFNQANANIFRRTMLVTRP